jgi:hypothetical protein
VGLPQGGEEGLGCGYDACLNDGGRQGGDFDEHRIGEYIFVSFLICLFVFIIVVSDQFRFCVNS